uniref:ORF48c n=1 Tax=Pinus koraiensis TaxID=88728 RepID=A4QM67_PINKO|nr:ORF48c [Pinus koraiensis]ABP35405.1 ORF48c [Pinus koraiensis]
MIKSYYINLLNLNSNLLSRYPLQHLDLLQLWNYRSIVGIIYPILIRME